MKNLAASDNRKCDTEGYFRFDQLVLPFPLSYIYSDVIIEPFPLGFTSSKVVVGVRKVKYYFVSKSSALDEFMCGGEPDRYWEIPNRFGFDDELNPIVASNKRMFGMRDVDEWQGQLKEIVHYLRDPKLCTRLSGQLVNTVICWFP